MISNCLKILTLVTLLLASSARRCSITEIGEGYFDVQDEQSFSQKTTILTFYIEQKAEQEQDYIQMSLTIKEKENSLKKAIDKANKKVLLVEEQCEDYCKRNKGKNCDKRVQIDNFKAEPSYQILRKQPVFNGFVVTNIAKIQVLETENIGQLVDTLLGLGIYQMDELEWKPFIEIDSVEKAIDSGISQATELCRHIGKKIGTILSITQIFEEDDDFEKKNDKQGQDEDNDEEEPAILKFEVECIGKTPEEIEAQNDEKAKQPKKTKGKK